MKRDKKGRFIKKKKGYERKSPIKQELRSIIDRVDEIRFFIGLNKTEFCKRFRMTPQTYNNFLGKQGSKPSIELILGVCNVYHVDPLWLMTGKGTVWDENYVAMTGNFPVCVGNKY